MAHFVVLLTILSIFSFANCKWEDNPMCGLYRNADITTRVFNGTDVYLGEHPWVVHLRFHDQDCTGGILNRRWILTAAHCIYSAHGTNIEITYGRLDPKINKGGGAVRRIKGNEDVNIFRYPGDPGSLTEDVGLVYVNEGRDIPLPNNLRDIKGVNSMCLLPPTAFLYTSGEKVSIAGFGDKGVSTQFPELLTQTAQVIENPRICKYYTTVFSDKKQFCHYDSSPSASLPCGGDSGAPVVHYESVKGIDELAAEKMSDRRAFAVGIHVKGPDDCGYSTATVRVGGYRDVGVAMRIDQYIDWIEQVITDKTCAEPSKCSIS